MEFEKIGFDMEKLNSIRSFSGRVKYCQQNLERVGSGSARVVFALDEERVIKIASNEKGIAQNDVESDFGLQDMYGDIVNKVHDACEDGKWIIADRLAKITKKQMLDHLGVSGGQLEEVCLLINNYVNQHKHDILSFKDSINANKTLENLIEMSMNYDLLAGDFSRTNSWGMGKDGHIKLIDNGLSKNVFNTHYLKHKSVCFPDDFSLRR